ncbi:DUF2922 domain-containing protein [Desulfitobacterium sp.]|uniref:DUF2922 domain-containing protein n=1 Tax=Desulfitobacterium sp. TaxID=49981 RepID=UPI002BFD8CDA|nr:DUF2922 domain-containing protein [Desulfitobacterium sp.]HVJ50333.1 DUF2922 domain-containing protein [Desulfitobacterium sp.]
MATTSKKVLRMVFANAQGGAVSLTLSDPKAGITAAEIETVMDLIIAKNIFTGTGGAWVSKRDIKIVDTTTNDLYDVPVV